MKITCLLASLLSLIILAPGHAVAESFEVAGAYPDAISVLTLVEVKPGTENQFIREIQPIIQPSRREAGNLAWFVQRSVERPNEFVFYTRWVDEAALQYHLATPPLKKYLARTAPLMAKPAKLIRFRPVDTGL